MLLIVGIVLLALGITLGLLILFANGMSDSPGGSVGFFPALVLIVLAVLCFVLRHFLAGKSISW